ncbi:MAG: hypothetical protein KDA95_07215 [Acidimicrobiales bacterium]|nr:hypothetical protein [Acidimicrobiales bacterium]
MSSQEVFTGDAQIIDRGYRKYDGVRTGVFGAQRAVFRHSVQRALGMRRTIWAKLLPIATIGFAYVPAIVFVGIVALFPKADTAGLVLPSYGDYYGFIIAAIMAFVALVAPEVLCTDRRSGMLGIYLAAPLNRDTYLIAKSAAIGFVVSLVCLGPPLFMFLANVLQSQGPEGAGETLSTLGSVLLAGLLTTALYTGITVGITSLTDRKFIAMAAIIMLFLVTISTAGMIDGVGGPRGIYCFAPTMLSLEIALRVHGESSIIMYDVPSSTLYVAWAVWTFGGFAIARNRLRRLPVTR